MSGLFFYPPTLIIRRKRLDSMMKTIEEITVQVLLFSVLKDALNSNQLEVTLPAGATGQTLLNQLSAEHPVIEKHRKVIRLAVNAAYVQDVVELNAGDEIALITPVSGG